MTVLDFPAPATTAARRSLVPVVAAAPIRERWDNIWVSGRRVEMAHMGSGDPLVFLHGWGLSPRSYLTGLRHLAAHHSVIAPSLPGFGGSEALPASTAGLGGVASHMADALTEMALPGPVDVAAHSFGCGLALRTAVNRPDLVRSLTLICPVGGAAGGTVNLPAMWMGLLQEATPGMTRRALADFLPAMARNPLQVVVSGFAARRADLLDDVRTVVNRGIPVRMVFADKDEVLKPGDLPICAPGLDVHTVSGRHGWLIARPAAFAQVVLDHTRRSTLPPAAA